MTVSLAAWTLMLAPLPAQGETRWPGGPAPLVAAAEFKNDDRPGLDVVITERVPQTQPYRARVGDRDELRERAVLVPVMRMWRLTLDDNLRVFTHDGKRVQPREKSVFEEGVPPVGPVAKRAKREGALLELDKHNWPWSMMLVPVMGVDLYELANNHLWRTEFGFPDFGEPAADWMKVERGRQGFTE